MKKRCFVLWTAIIMMGFVLGNTSVYAKGEATLTASTVITEKNKAAISVSLDGNPGIWGMKFTVGYDHSALTLSSVENGEIFSDGDVTMPDSLDKKEFVYFASSNNLKDITENGVIVTLNFKVADYAAEGKYPIKLTLTQAINVDGENVDIDIQDGEVTIFYEVDKEDVVFDKSKDESLTIPLQKNGKIKKVEIDKEVVEPKKYKADKKKNIVISDEYMKGLNDGKHKVTIVTKGGTTETDFIVKTDASKELNTQSTKTAKAKMNTDKESQLTKSEEGMNVLKIIIVSIVTIAVIAGITYIRIKRKKGEKI